METVPPSSTKIKKNQVKSDTFSSFENIIPEIKIRNARFATQHPTLKTQNCL